MNVINYEVILGCAGIIIGLLVNLSAEFLPRKYAKTVTKENQKISILNQMNYKRIRKILILILYAYTTITIGSVSRNGFDFILTLSLLAYIGLIFIIDLEFRVIMNSMIILGVVLGLVFGINFHGIVNTLQGGIVGLFVLMVLYYLGRILMPYLAHLRNHVLNKQALYKNDVFLGLIMGLILGWNGVLNGLLISLLLFGTVGVFSIIGMILLDKYDPNLAIPLGPFMVLGVVICLSIHHVL